MKKTASQKVAFGLEILGYILLIPLSLWELYLLFFPPVFLTTIFIYGFGVLLLVGYHKHRRNRINREWALLLWIGTILFNGFPLVLLLFLISQLGIANDADKGARIVFYNAGSAYFIIVYYSIYAFCVDLRRDFEDQLVALNLN